MDDSFSLSQSISVEFESSNGRNFHTSIDKRRNMASKGKLKKKQKYPSHENLSQDSSELQDLMQEVDKMSPDKVQEQLLQMLNENDLPEKSKIDILNKDIRTQHMILKSYIFKKHGMADKGKCSVEEFIEQLKTSQPAEEMIPILEKLRVAVGTYHMNWLHDFADKNGHVKLINLMKHWNEVKPDEKTQKLILLCVRCMKAFMNNRFGFDKMFSVDSSLEILYSTIFVGSDQILTETMRVLAPICFLNHGKVLAALTNQAIKKNQARFDPVIQCMLESDQPLVQAACFLFLNSLLAPVEDPNFRIHLRCEMVRAGLESFIKEIGSTVSEEIEVQLQVYERLKSGDLDELSCKWNRIQTDFSDPDSAFQLLSILTQGTEASKSFLSILQHLLLIRDDYYVRPLYFKLIEQCVTQIVLQKNGSDPDFLTHRKFELSVDPIIDNMLNKAQVEESRERALKFEQQVKDEQLRFHELEVHSSLLQQKFDELQERIERGGIVAPAEATGGKENETGEMGVTEGGTKVEGKNAPEPRPVMSHSSSIVSVSTAKGTFKIPCPPPDLPEIQPNVPQPPPDLPEVALKLGVRSDTSTLQRRGVQLNKKKYDPVPGMSHFFWKKINEQDITHDTIWVGLNEHSLLTEKIDTSLSRKFVKQGGNFDLEVKLEKGEKAPTSRIDAAEPQVISKQAAQNISIFLRSSKFSSEQIKRMIISMDDALTEQMLVDLLKFLPSSIDIQKLNDLKKKHTFENLNVSERFLLVVTKIDRLELRLRTMIFRRRFKDEIHELVPQLRCIKDTSEKVKNSKRFRRVLEYVLLVGNKMNAGTKHAQTAGFHLESLTKLDGTKTNDQTLNLMHFIVDIIEEAEPDLLKFVLDLEEVKTAAKVNDENLRGQIRNISNSIDEIKQELKHYSNESKLEHYERYHKVMPEFLKETEQEHKLLKKMYKDMESSLHETIKWFAMDPRKVTTEDFFTYFVKFIANFERARKENLQIRELKKKEAHKREVEEAARKKRENMKRKEDSVFTNSDEIVGKDKKGLLDDLLSKLEQGEVGPKKNVQKKTSGNRPAIVLHQKQHTKRQLSSVDENKMKEPSEPLSSAKGFQNINENQAAAPSYPTESEFQTPQTPSTYNNIAKYQHADANYGNDLKTTPSYNNKFSAPYKPQPVMSSSYSVRPQPRMYSSYNTNPEPPISNYGIDPNILPTNKPTTPYKPQPVMSSSYTSNTPNLAPSYNPESRITPPYLSNTQSTQKTPSYNTYAQKVPSSYAKDPEIYPTKPPPPKQIPLQERPVSKPVAPPRTFTQNSDDLTLDFEQRRLKQPIINPRTAVQPSSPVQDDVNGFATDISRPPVNDAIAMFNKVGQSRKINSRNSRPDESTYF